MALAGIWNLRRLAARAKLALVLVLVAHHVWLGKLMREFAADRNTHGDRFYRWINEIPAAPALAAIIYIVVAKPF